MRIIEQKLVGKHTQETCEDGIVVTDNFIAVIDGSTSKTKIQLNSGMKNGRYCMMLIANYIQHARPRRLPMKFFVFIPMMLLSRLHTLKHVCAPASLYTVRQTTKYG